MNRVIAIVGPTAVGKTSLSIELGEVLGAEIVNADSRQVYRGMDIGTGKPTPKDRRLVPHHVFDVVAPDEQFSLATYLDLTRDAIEGIHSRRKPALLVGGTGQYVWALLEGWQIPQVAPNEVFRRALTDRASREGAEALHAELAAIDPVAAASIHPNNLRRTIRALEVTQATGLPFSTVRAAQAPSWQIQVIGLTVERQLLNQRIAARVGDQIDAGWRDEVASLLSQGYAPELPAFSSLGYREMSAHVRGEIGLVEVARTIIARTRRFAHHQYAWFRLDDARIKWLDGTTVSTPAALELVGSEVR